MLGVEQLVGIRWAVGVIKAKAQRCKGHQSRPKRAGATIIRATWEPGDVAIKEKERPGEYYPYTQVDDMAPSPKSKRGFI